MKSCHLSVFIVCAFAAPALAELLVDFNSTSQDSGPHLQTGYNAYDAAHEAPADFVDARTYTAFGSSISLQVDFPDSSDRRVQQMIDRGGNNDANWTGTKPDLVTDWIGVDTRASNGGNGNYDGINGTPTRIVLTLENLPPATYRWRSYHHDTEHMNGRFFVDYSTDGGGSYTRVDGPLDAGAFRQTDSTPGGNPESETIYRGPSPENLPSTVEFEFATTGRNDFMVRVTPLSATAVHAQFAVINGFEILQTAPTDAPTDLTLSNTTVSRSAPVGTLVGSLGTSDVTPADSHSYTLVAGPGDDDNAKFDIVNDRLITNRELGSFPLASPLNIRIRTTDLIGNYLEEAFTIDLVNDSDNDGLEDDWELIYFADLTVATGSGNNDSDTLDNLSEQERGTNPVLGDTDSDGLNDDLEDGSGVFGGPDNPGSSPLLADTDGDGLTDGLEVSSVNGHVTDPNLVDSDADNFSDPVELTEGSDPNNPTNFPDILLPLILNEIMARNETGIQDGFGRREDWIELHNPNPAAVNLDGYFLTDDASQLTKWNFPSIEISGGGYLIVFASGINTIDPSGNPHTNFKLESAGEYLAIVRPNGTSIDNSFHPDFPEQFADISYGPQSIDSSLGFFSLPTPNVANGSGFPGVVKDTNFSDNRGFYDAPLRVEVTSDTPGAIIRYTTDGSRPSESDGTLYTEPVSVGTTTTLRAIAYRPGWLSSNVDTQTYIFVDDVAQQPANPPGWPADWSNSGDPSAIHPADYEMDQRVVRNTLPGYGIREALLDIPSVSIAMEPRDFLNAEGQAATGIYSNPRSRFERPCSIEYIRPDGIRGFQYDAKIEVHGNASRRAARMHKHSLRVTFTSEFGGPGRLEYPLFPESPVERFNKLVLRACFTDSWGLVSWASNRYRPNDSQYFRDVWMKESLRAMGQPSSYGNFVHLYVNGLYFGLHNLTERLEDDFWAEHLGGAKEDWEINKDLSGGGSRWNQMISIANGNIASARNYERIQDYLDVVNFADYMLLHFYADSEDWPHHNGYAAANSVSGDGKYRFWCWDQEIILDKYSWNRYGDNRGVGSLFQRLRQNAEFRILFADRAQKHFFNSGALSETESANRYLSIANRIDRAIVAESARWGDTQATTPYGDTPGSSRDIDADYYPPTINRPIYFTREQHWLVERDNVVNNYIPTLHDQSDSRSIIRELRANNLFPSIEAPQFSQFGGEAPLGFELGITGTAGTIYYTLDGSDPRMNGGAVNPLSRSIPTGASVDTLFPFEDLGWHYLDTGAQLSNSNVVAGHESFDSTDWKHPDFADDTWEAGPAMLGGDSTSDINEESLATIVDIGPSGNRHPTIYFRKHFNVDEAGGYTTLTADVKRDDGAILYLNGHEIGRTNMPEGTISALDFAATVTAGAAENAINRIVYTLAPGLLRNGDNVLAVELHQSSRGSGDLGIDVQLTALRPADPPVTVALNQTGTVSARILSAGEWSALSEASFVVGTTASAANLVVSEIMYNPAGASEDSEYVELMNISDSESIDLTNVHFDAGLDYEFPTGFILAPLERTVVVKNQTVFAETYPVAGVKIAPGTFIGNLSNSGEEIAVKDGSGVDIRRFTYRDSYPWPEGPDGMGYALVLISPAHNPDHSLPQNWRGSASPGGFPGGTDAEAFVGDPDSDGDHDGRTAFLEYAMARSDENPAEGPLFILGSTIYDNGSGSGPQEFLELTFTRNLTADDALIEAETSTNLVTWFPLDAILTARINHDDGTSTETYRSSASIDSSLRKFLRLKVTRR